MRWISLSSAHAQLNKNPHKVRALAKIGVFEGRKVGHWEQFALEPQHDRQTLMDLFYQKHGTCSDRQACLRVKKAVDLLTGQPQVVPPRAFMDDAMQVMRDTEMDLTPANLGILTGATLTVARRHIIDWSASNGDLAPDTASHFSAPSGDHEKLVVARLSPHLRTAPGTYLAPGGHPDDKPSETVFARLNSIRDQVLFEAITLDALRLAAARTNAVLLEKSVRAFQSFDVALKSRNSRDPFVMREQLETKLGPQWTVAKKAEGNSCETVMHYLHVHDRLQEYFDHVVPSAQGGFFRPHQLTMPAGHEKFFRQVKNAVVRYQKACAASRQTRIESILDNPLEFLLVGRLRLQEHTVIRDACRNEIDKLIKSGETLVEPMRFQVSYETRLINDRFRRCKQTIHLSIWSWDLLHERLRAASDSTGERPPMYARNQEENPRLRSSYVISYLGVTPQTPGAPIQTPLITEIADSFAMCSSGNLTIDQRDRQAAAFKRWEFSEKLGKPSGVPWFKGNRRHAVQEANALLVETRADGADASVVLLPHDEFCHGLMFGHAVVFIAADAGCRTGETLLAPSLPAAYEAITDPKTGEVFKRFESIGKFGKKVQPMVSPDTFRHLTDLIIESAVRWHGGKLAPPVAPNHHFQAREIKTVARYAFTVAERMINYSEAAALARILYFGWHGVKGHDVRHLFNAMGRRAGIPSDVRQRIMNHADPGSTELYGPATPSEVNRRQIQLNRQTSDNMAQLLESAAEGMSEDMVLALRELRRAELNVRYYEEGGWLDEAERVRRDVEIWADKLARATADHTRGGQVVNTDAI